MNAQKIWPGTDYAYGYRHKGAPLPVNAERVKVRRLIKKPAGYGAKRDRTVVEVMLVNDETGMPDDIDNPIIKEVRGRDILEFWDEYIETVEDEREEYFERKRKAEEERKERQRQREEQDAAYYVCMFLRNSWRIKLQRDKEEQERIEREERRRRFMRMYNVLVGRGFNRDSIAILDNYDSIGKDPQVVINLDEMERWLGFDK